MSVIIEKYGNKMSYLSYVHQMWNTSIFPIQHSLIYLEPEIVYDLYHKHKCFPVTLGNIEYNKYFIKIRMNETWTYDSYMEVKKRHVRRKKLCSRGKRGGGQFLSKPSKRDVARRAYNSSAAPSNWTATCCCALLFFPAVESTLKWWALYVHCFVNIY